MADHLPAYFLKLYGEGVLSLFDSYYQDLVKDAKWINDQLYYNNEIKLNKAINNDIDLEWIIKEDKPSTKKRVQIYEEDNATIVFYKTSDYVVGAKSVESVEEIDID